MKPIWEMSHAELEEMTTRLTALTMRQKWEEVKKAVYGEPETESDKPEAE